MSINHLKSLVDPIVPYLNVGCNSLQINGPNGLALQNSSGIVTNLNNSISTANCTFELPNMAAGTYVLSTASGGSVTQQEMVYVMLNGNDSTGNGSFDSPYLTVAHACSSITDSGPSKRYIIMVMAGTYVETVSPQIPTYTTLVGQECLGTACRINVTAAGNNLLFNTAQIAAGNFRASISNIYLTGSTNLLVDCYSYGGSASCVISLTSVQMNGNLTFNGRPLSGPSTADFLEVFDGASYVFGNVNVNGGQILLSGLICAGNMNISTKDTGVAGTSVLVTGNIFGSSCTTLALNSGAVTTLAITNGSSQFTNLSVTGSTAVLSSDNISLPLNSNITLASGGSIVLLSDAYGVKYLPAVSANWTQKFGSIPSTVQGALDVIANRGKTISAYINSSGSIVSQTGGIASASFTVAGTLVLTLTSGYFIGTPYVSSNIVATVATTNDYAVTYNYTLSTATSVTLYITQNTVATSLAVSVFISGI